MRVQRLTEEQEVAYNAVLSTADEGGRTTTRQVRAVLRHGMEEIGRLTRALERQGLVRFDRQGIQVLKRPDAQASAAPALRYVITSAVSGSPVHARFLRALETYCRHRNARLMVVPIRYRNPTSKLERPEDWFDPKLAPYLTRQRVELCPGLMLMADVPTQPTASRPLSGLTTMSGGASAIFGHTKIALESVATRLHEPAKLAVTTGAVTEARYSESKSGKKGEFHHVYGAVAVESCNGRFHVRHLNANADGGFYDLGERWTDDGPIPQDVKVVTLGDLHGVRADAQVMDATFGAADSLIRTLRPRKIVLHDVIDFQAGSHHNSFFDNFALQSRGERNVTQELVATFQLIDDIAAAAPEAELVVVDSNHHDHFTKWLGDPTRAHDIENALVYHETKVAILRALQAGERHPSPLEFWGRRLLKNGGRITFLKVGESFSVDGVEYGSHGHRGPNGARGSIAAFTKVGAKMVIGHSHTPGIMDGCYQVGTSSLMDMGYNADALSSWMHTHCIHYRNGKRALVNIIDGKWRC